MQTPASSPSPKHTSEPLPPLRAAGRSLHFRPAWAGPARPFRHTWEGIINVDQFRWFIRRDTQEQLTLARSELGARHVRAVGMFDDELRVFRPSPAAFMGYEAAEPRTNWQIVDYVMDSLLDRGLQPMFTTSFVPSAMASRPGTVFTTKATTSPPRDWKQWEAFVTEAVRHAVERYSLSVVRQWYFEVWNEPNLHGSFWHGTQEDFFCLWRSTHRAIKSVDASLRVGGPSTAHAEWLGELVAFGDRHDCAPDYLITHMYNNDATMQNPLAPFDGPQIDKNNKSPNACIGVMRGIRRAVDELGFKGELHWNEWGRSFHGIDYRREHPSEAAFVVRLLAEISQEADAFAYWCLSDIYDQVGYGRETFHGGYGLLSQQGLRKPTYHAFQLLGRLGRERLAVTGDGLDSFSNAIVTTSPDGKRHVLVYAYDHADNPARESVEVRIDLPARARPTGLFRIDLTENNVITQWKEIGAPAYLSREQLRELAARNELQSCLASLRIEQDDGRPVARFTMESPGVALLELEA